MEPNERAGEGVGVQTATDITHQGGMRGNRVMPTPVRDHLDPFVVFERFFIAADQGFSTHPHRGFEIVSYMVEGGMVHEDSLGESHTAYPGDAMRITTGSGIEHSELPADGAPCNGLQLWVNLPRDRKDDDPVFQDVSGDDLPTEDAGDATVTTVVGEGSPIELATDVTYLDVTVEGSWTWDPPAGWSGFLYGVDGSGTVDGAEFGTEEFALLDGITEETRVTVESDEGVRLAAIAGAPHGEPIVQRGPFVE
ncbi:pirin family protein [Halosimplex rubrum]|uniref:Pirin family protein n=1 Tax=Halosimplex rubrum TaxID=869889 RepID=A0A7D5TEV3_9EURY|nr:pirin family protein [Halosimplex rubrum]QLH79796.1 pirin family protein [Halosimplex rubrum]